MDSIEKNKKELPIEVCPVDTDLAFGDWLDMRSRNRVKSYGLDYSAPQTSGRIQLDEAQRAWRARQVEVSIASFACNAFTLAIVTEMTKHMAQGNAAWSFRKSPDCGNAPVMVEDLFRDIKGILVGLLEAGEGYPQPTYDIPDTEA